MNVQTGQWEEMPGAWTAEGDFWYISKTGEENITTVEMLMQVTGWDGTPQQLAGVDENFVQLPEEKRWKPNPVIVTIKEEEYNGQKQHKVRSIRRADATRVQVPESAARRLAEKMSKARKGATANESGVPF